MEEVMKLLGPWPVLQFMFGVAVLGGGVWMIIRGTQKKDAPPQGGTQALEDKRAEWRAYDQLENIEQNSFKQLAVMSQILDRLNNNADQMKALAAAIWNKREGL
jgi:hypothetical protein